MTLWSPIWVLDFRFLTWVTNLSDTWLGWDKLRADVGGDGVINLASIKSFVDIFEWTVVCPGWIDVAWDAGGTNSYRMGAEGKYDLMLAPSHNPEKARKDVLSPRLLSKVKGLSAEGSDTKNKVWDNSFSFCNEHYTWSIAHFMS